MKNILRIIDANLNRAKEGLRVVEDFARFVLEEARLSSDIKKLRHQIDKIARKIYPQLVLSRNSESDIFREKKESGKKDKFAVVVSNIKRAEESLRVLEEFSKTISANAGAKFKKIRFKIYGIEKEIVTTAELTRN
ncbi:MAG TPA: thiamine-phosphate pyrophosphorylase [Elusimicrobia bacterium]|nr:thiamine-phosphate pyrophosphorylase [Elusimicrobiota bacterium]